MEAVGSTETAVKLRHTTLHHTSFLLFQRISERDREKNRSESATYGPNFKPEASPIKGRCDKTLVTSRRCAVSQVKGLRGQKKSSGSISKPDYLLGGEQRRNIASQPEYSRALSIRGMRRRKF